MENSSCTGGTVLILYWPGDAVCWQALEERDRILQQLQQVSSLQQQLAAATAAAADSAASAAEFQEKFIRERAIRRRLHEQLQVRAAGAVSTAG